MPAKPQPLYPRTERELRALGERLREARLRRRFSAVTVAARAGISRITLYKVERGDGAVTMGSYAQVLRVLGLESDLSCLGRDDTLGRKLQDEALPQRRRAPRARRATAVKAPVVTETGHG